MRSPPEGLDPQLSSSGGEGRTLLDLKGGIEAFPSSDLHHLLRQSRMQSQCLMLALQTSQLSHKGPQLPRRLSQMSLLVLLVQSSSGAVQDPAYDGKVLVA